MKSKQHSTPASTAENLATLPGHWLLARMGKRVLRPGGLELTRAMLGALAIGRADEVVEFAPGLGITARMALAGEPAGYTGVERDEAAAARVRRRIGGPGRRCLVGDAAETGLPDACASVVYGEAMLSMQGAAQKAAIMREAHRLLRPGGRYGIHELAFTRNDVGEEVRKAVAGGVSDSIRVGARPMTEAEWRALLEEAGFTVKAVRSAPMHLLEPRRLLRDEGLAGALRFAFNVLRTPVARRRVAGMRATFRRHQADLSAIMLVAVKPGPA